MSHGEGRRCRGVPRKDSGFSSSPLESRFALEASPSPRGEWGTLRDSPPHPTELCTQIQHPAMVPLPGMAAGPWGHPKECQNPREKANG